MKEGKIKEKEDNTLQMIEGVDGEETVEEEDTPVVRPYSLRKLKDCDLFKLLKIFRKIGIKEFKDAFIQVASGEKTINQIGIMAVFDIVDILICNIPKAEEEIYDLWSDLSGYPPEEIKEMEFGTLPLMIADTFSEVKNTSFFRVLSKLL